MLPPINTNAKLEEIQKWKSGSSVRNCYNKLFKQIKQGENLYSNTSKKYGLKVNIKKNSNILSCLTGEKTYIIRIIEKAWPKTTIDKLPDISIAYAISIVEALLDPETTNIQMSETIMNRKINENLKNIVSALIIS